MIDMHKTICEKIDSCDFNYSESLSKIKAIHLEFDIFWRVY